MAAEIIKPGVTEYRLTCPECAALFRYKLDDVRMNYAYGQKVVFCPGCGHSCRHYGAQRPFAECGS